MNKIDKNNNLNKYILIKLNTLGCLAECINNITDIYI